MKILTLLFITLLLFTGCLNKQPKVDETVTTTKKTVNAESLLCKVNTITLYSGKMINKKTNYDSSASKAILIDNVLTLTNIKDSETIIGKVISTKNEKRGHSNKTFYHLTGYNKVTNAKGYHLYLTKTHTKIGRIDNIVTIMSVYNPTDKTDTSYSCIEK